MHRKGHLIGATFSWAVAISVYYVLAKFTAVTDFASRHGMWIVLSFLACHFGAQLPDYDVIWKKLLPHRNVVTHSLFLPLLICLPIFFITDEMIFLTPIFAMYLIGQASHLFLDLNPEKWAGTALIHIYWRNSDGRKTLSKANSQFFLILNGMIILAAGVILLYFFNAWIA
ncbi:MAG: hypothetical protein V3V41_04790 [Candidatus Heimdallarchaeota archaeon]